jgi:thioredoxin
MDAQVIRCPACGQANRVPDGVNGIGSGKKAVCGKCKAALDPGGTPRILTDATFAQALGDGPSVVDFWAAWCGPCRMIGPIIETLAAERSDVTFAKLNDDENPRTAAQYGVQGIPLLIFFRDGSEKGRVVGAVPRGQIEAAIQRYLG